MRRPSPALLWFFIMLAGAVVAITAATNKAAATAVSIGAGGFIAGIGFLKLLYSRSQA